MELGIKGKTVVVTGGASNIGRAITLAFAGEGCNVVIADLDEKQAEKVAKQADSLGGNAIVVKTDVADFDQVKQMAQRTLDEFGAIDILVNNVGYEEVKYFLEATPEFWDKVIAINYKGVIHCMQAVLPHMVERNQGAIVSVSSDASRIGEFKESIYGGCKAGVNNITKTIAREVGPKGIRLNVVCPGTTAPESSDDFGDMSMWTRGRVTPEMQERIAKGYPLRKTGKATDIATAVLFLASDDVAGHITGQILSVSGGYTMM